MRRSYCVSLVPEIICTFFIEDTYFFDQFAQQLGANDEKAG